MDVYRVGAIGGAVAAAAGASPFSSNFASTNRSIAFRAHAERLKVTDKKALAAWAEAQPIEISHVVPVMRSEEAQVMSLRRGHGVVGGAVLDEGGGGR